MQLITSVFTFDTQHTPDTPYCSSIDCQCHTNITYHEQVQYPAPTDSEISSALSFFEIEEVGQ